MIELGLKALLLAAVPVGGARLGSYGVWMTRGGKKEGDWVGGGKQAEECVVMSCTGKLLTLVQLVTGVPCGTVVALMVCGCAVVRTGLVRRARHHHRYNFSHCASICCRRVRQNACTTSLQTCTACLSLAGFSKSCLCNTKVGEEPEETPSAQTHILLVSHCVQHPRYALGRQTTHF